VRYKPKSIAALQVALGGLPDAMHVEADRGIGLSAKTVGQLRKVAAWPDNLVITTPGTLSRERNKSEQDECCDAGLTKTLSRSSSGYRLRYFGVRRSIVL
jgi:hypothetical protein